VRNHGRVRPVGACLSGQDVLVAWHILRKSCTAFQGLQFCALLETNSHGEHVLH